MTWQSWKDVFDLVTKGIGALIALASVIYLLGGTVLAGRLILYQLPWEIVINQLPQGFLVTIGVTEVLTPLIVVGFIYLLTLLAARRLKPWRRRLLERWRKPPHSRKRHPLREIALWAFYGLVVFLVSRLVLHAASGWTPLETGVAVALAAGGVVTTYLVVSGFTRIATDWTEHRVSELMRATVVALALLPLIAWNAVTLPVPFARVCPTKSVPGANGWLIGQANDRLILGNPDEDPDRRNVFLTPSSGATIMVTYQDPKLVPLPPCPAIPSATG